MNENQEESGFDFIRLVFVYISRRLNVSHLLYFFVFITFDVGDAVTATVMMDSKGLGAEYNIIIQYIYYNYGLAGLITAKLWLIIVPLMVASTMVKGSFWLINGILSALIIFGIMATRANIQEISGLPHMSPMEINTIYLIMLFLFGFAGMVIDDYSEHKAKNFLYGQMKDPP